MLFASANFFKSYCVHGRDAQTDSQRERQTDIFFLFRVRRHTKHGHSSKGENLVFFFYSCD